MLFFTRPNCEPCDALLARLLARIDRIAGLDIYLAEIDTSDGGAVREWAVKWGIDPEWVLGRKVNLNFEAGALTDLTDGQGEIPTLMRRRAEVLSLVSTAEL